MAESLRPTRNAVADAVCAAAVVVGQAVSIAILSATILYIGWCATRGLQPLSLVGALTLLPFVGTIVAGRGLRQKLQRRRARPWAHAWFVGFALASMLVSFEWFRNPMHDIALIFGSHGRWGCGTVNADGSPVFFLRDSTVPFLLFAPILVLTAGHWLLSVSPRPSSGAHS